MAVSRNGRVSLDAKHMDLTGDVYEDECKPREYLWGAELTKDKPTCLWSFNEDDEEDSTDKDFLTHTLALKYVMLGAGSGSGTHVIEVETKAYDGEAIKMPLAILTKEKLEMMQIDLTFTSEHPVEFRLVSGTGPVCLLGQHILEYPVGAVDEEESEYDTELSETEEVTVLPKSKKRKANDTPKSTKNKKSKLDAMETADGDLEDEEDEDSDGEVEEEIETPPDTVSNSSSEDEIQDIKKKRAVRKGAKETKVVAKKETPAAKGNPKKKQRKTK